MDIDAKYLEYLFENNTQEALAKAARDGVSRSLRGDFFKAAISHGTAQVVQACIESGETLEDDHLYYALIAKNADALKALIAAGANLSVASRLNWVVRDTFFPEAMENNPEAEKFKACLDKGEEILNILRDAGASVPPEKTTYLSCRRCEDFIIEYEWDCLDRQRYKNGSGVQALWSAVSPKALQKLIEESPDVKAAARYDFGGDDCKDSDSDSSQTCVWTVMHDVAQRYGYFDPDGMMRCLVDAGCDVNARSPEGTTPLMLAAGEIRACPRALEMVKLLLKSGADFDAVDEGGRGVVWWATDWWNFKCHGEESVLAEILEEMRDMPPNSVNFDLMTTAFWGTPTDLAAILSQGADVNARTSRGYTPLMFSSVYNESEAVKFLIESGAEVNAKNEAGETALSLAQDTRDFSVIKTLAEAGARQRFKDQESGAYECFFDAYGDVSAWSSKHGLTIKPELGGTLRSLFELNDPYILARAVKDGLTFETDPVNFGWSLFLEALERGHLQVIRACAEMGADVNCRSYGGEHFWTRGPASSPLGIAIKAGHIEAIKILLEAGANTEIVNELDFAYRSAVFPEAEEDVNLEEEDYDERGYVKSVLERGVEILKVLREAGANIPDDPELSFVAIDSGNGILYENGDARKLLMAASPGAMRRLIESGADVNARCKNGLTVLSAIVRNASCCFFYDHLIEMLIELIDAGADVNAFGTLHDIADCLDVYKNAGAAELLMCCIKAGADFAAPGSNGDPAWLSTAHRDDVYHTRLIKELFGEIQNTFGSDTSQRRRMSALDAELMINAYYGSPCRIKSLVQMGANVNARSGHGYTPLMFAVGGEPDMVKALMDFGADPEALNNYGESPMSLALCRCENEQRDQIINLLAAAGAKVPEHGERLTAQDRYFIEFGLKVK
jgi:ankyrin repeat protein